VAGNARGAADPASAASAPATAQQPFNASRSQ
jgi:hypothetical protein